MRNNDQLRILEYLQDFLKLGLGTASIQVIISTQATQFSGVLLNKVPKLGLLVNERVHLYSGGDINMEVVKEFVNPLVPVTVNEVGTVWYVICIGCIINF